MLTSPEERHSTNLCRRLVLMERSRMSFAFLSLVDEDEDDDEWCMGMGIGAGEGDTSRWRLRCLTPFSGSILKDGKGGVNVLVGTLMRTWNEKRDRAHQSPLTIASASSRTVFAGFRLFP